MDGGAIGIARPPASEAFYASFFPLRIVGSEVGIEVVFNPEFVVIDGVETDVIVAWGVMEEVSEQVDQLLTDLNIELCPTEIESGVRERLFSRESKNIESIDAEDPWSITP